MAKVSGHQVEGHGKGQRPAGRKAIAKVRGHQLEGIAKVTGQARGPREANVRAAAGK
jgi:hypothetical protein